MFYASPYYSKPITDEELKGLEIEFCGKIMRTPFGFGATGPLFHPLTQEYWLKSAIMVAKAGAGYVTFRERHKWTKEEVEAIVSRHKEGGLPNEDVMAFFTSTRAYQSPWGILGIGLLPGMPPGQLRPGVYLKRGMGVSREDSEKHRESARKLLQRYRKALPDNVAIIGYTGGVGMYPEGFLPNIKFFDEIGVDLIVIIQSCTYPLGYKDYVRWYLQRSFPPVECGYGLLLMKEHMCDIIRAAVREVHTPIGIKMSPEIGYLQIIELVKAFKEAGASFIETMNCGVSVIPPDIYNPKGSPLKNTRNNFRGGMSVSGPALLPQTYKWVNAIEEFIPDMYVLAIGGLSSPENCMEVMMLGAEATGQCTEVLARGTDVLRANVHFFHKYLKEHGYKSVKEIIGIHRPKPLEELDLVKDEVYRAQVDPSKCTGCGICINRPNCFANRIVKGKAEVNWEICGGCGLCVIFCPYQARALVKVK